MTCSFASIATAAAHSQEGGVSNLRDVVQGSSLRDEGVPSEVLTPASCCGCEGVCSA